MTTRLSMNLNDESAALLRKAADDEGRTITEVVRRALGVYDFVMAEARNGSQVRVTRADGSSGLVTFL